MLTLQIPARPVRRVRRSFYTLSGMVTNQMGRNVQDGDVYIFINRTCAGMKILHMECGGLVIYHLKLESGCFKLPFFDPDTHTWTIQFLYRHTVNA